VPLRLLVEARYPEDADGVFVSALQFDELKEAMAGLAAYDGLPEGGEAKEGWIYKVDVTMWGVLKTKGHVIRVERLDRRNRRLQSREHNPSVKRWDHELTVEPDGQGGCIWRDSVVLDAGWMTPLTARFARMVYRRRHKRRGAAALSARLSRV
jgi:hypothetical protein